MNKQQLKDTIAAFDSSKAFAQSIGGTASNFSASMLGLSVYGAPKEDVQAAAAPKLAARFDLN